MIGVIVWAAVAVVGNGRSSTRISPVCSVLDYGARGDNVTEDTVVSLPVSMVVAGWWVPIDATGCMVHSGPLRVVTGHSTCNASSGRGDGEDAKRDVVCHGFPL
jgi:hypothetical protein